MLYCNKIIRIHCTCNLLHSTGFLFFKCMVIIFSCKEFYFYAECAVALNNIYHINTLLKFRSICVCVWMFFLMTVHERVTMRICW